ncbi:hypothetical protein VTK56DRAFT_98 [Thermocarpiscus australiensis]
MRSVRALQPALLRRQAALIRPPLTPLASRISISAPRLNRPSSTLNTSPRPVDGLVKIADDGLAIDSALLSGKGEAKRGALPFFWLRDNCRCTQCVNRDTRQRNFNTFAIPSDIRPDAVRSDGNGVSVQWSDGHRSHYDWDFLQFYVSSDRRGGEGHQLHYWGAEAAERPPTVAYDRVMQTEDGVAELTANIKKSGFVFVEDTPYDDPDKTRQLLERIAFIRITHYGGFYDFIPDLAMADTAYTNLALPAHTDTTYFTDPAGLQAFHLLSHQPAPGTSPDESASGGKSLLVDGFNAARILKAEDPTAYDILSTVRLPWHASGNEGITITPDKLYPVLELDQYTGELHRIRWNNDDRGVVPFGEKHTPTEWYEAARKWDEILRREESECWIQLEPGKPLIFDNWRVLHGRSAFSGIRRICGGYINRDDYISRWRNTNFKRKDVLDRVIG